MPVPFYADVIAIDDFLDVWHLDFTAPILTNQLQLQATGVASSWTAASTAHHGMQIAYEMGRKWVSLWPMPEISFSLWMVKQWFTLKEPRRVGKTGSRINHPFEEASVFILCVWFSAQSELRINSLQSTLSVIQPRSHFSRWSPRTHASHRRRLCRHSCGVSLT